MRVYIGWDGRDALAFEVCKRSLLEYASIPLEILPLKDWDLRNAGYYWRTYEVDAQGQRFDHRDGKPFSTDFSFTRFCVPVMEANSPDWVLFQDADMLWRRDIADLVAEIDDSKALMCVQHRHEPPEETKMGGLTLQQAYPRKNWSSLMLMRPDRIRLSNYDVNNRSGSWLHSMCWLEDDQIGALDESWNWLSGWSSPEIEPAIVHFTRGTPDMLGCEDQPYADEWQILASEVSIAEPTRFHPPAERVA
ncbi:MAG: glycosyltransferase [Geminicoccaceae bacterium]